MKKNTLKKILTQCDWLFSKLWLVIAKIYEVIVWVWSNIVDQLTIAWKKIEKKDHPRWVFLGRTLKFITTPICRPLGKIIDGGKQLLDRSSKARAIFFIGTPLLIILYLWPPWNWGRWYGYQSGIASYYGQGFYFNRTANGDLFLPGPFFTAAHNNLPFGTKVLVIDKTTGSSVVVIINDRGPFVGGRIIDLSVAAAIRLGIYNRGIAKVTLYTRKPGYKQILYYPFK